MRVINKYTEEFRTDAAKLALQGDRSVKQVAADLGVNHWTLREWVRSEQLGKRRKKAPAKAAPASPATETPEQKLKRLERENQRLQKENDSLRMDREILKKAAAFFAKESE